MATLKEEIYTAIVGKCISDASCVKRWEKCSPDHIDRSLVA